MAFYLFFWVLRYSKLLMYEFLFVGYVEPDTLHIFFLKYFKCNSSKVQVFIISLFLVISGRETSPWRKPVVERMLDFSENSSSVSVVLFACLIQSLVLISKLPYVTFFHSLLKIMAPEYFEKQEPCLEAGESDRSWTLCSCWNVKNINTTRCLESQEDKTTVKPSV